MFVSVESGTDWRLLYPLTRYAMFQCLNRRDGDSNHPLRLKIDLLIDGFNASIGVTVIRTQDCRDGSPLFHTCFNASIGVTVIRTSTLH